MVSPIRVWASRLLVLLALGGWCLTVLYVDPEAGGRTGQYLFYGTLFVWLSGVFGLGLWEVRRFFDGDESIKWRRSLRQGLLIGSFGTIALVLQQWRLLTWWDAALVAVALLLVELRGYVRDTKDSNK